ncbi:ATP-binding protein [Dyella caseinilytica]|uniref:histidine kinase n=1 Tax=Dyella caseinilytica TaxID=1849581 RepID=A0ABX7GQB1_9GAMM|nr:ATP-binding protein [Dyella caseinilytica]QRN52258.1 HAMP domain-containing protein [Dyella caseinilytica]GGA14410.1 two-component sensor histidine kinase [Dyella caseinilytica]
MLKLRLWPRSLFGRNLLLLLGLIAIAQMSTIVLYVLLQRPRVMEVAQLVATQVNMLDAALSQVPATDRDAYVARLNQVGALSAQLTEPPPDNFAYRTPLADLFIHEVRRNLAKGITLRLTSVPRLSIWVHLNISGERYWIKFPVNALVPYRWLTSALVLWLSLALSAALGALLIQRRINRPLRDIAGAAQNVGSGGRHARLPTYDASELAIVAKQFNAMLDNLEEMESSRTVMLAGISHDIRSPLAKLRLTLALDKHASELPVGQYIDQIDAIIGQFIDFGRVGSDERMVEGELNTLVEQLASGFAERGHAFALSLEPLPIWPFRPIAMMRLVQNLMENAVKYAGAGLEVHTYMEHDSMVLAVLDAGPGLAEGDEARLLQPFTRGDVGRSNTSGSGLGLAIVDRVARLHGGYLQLIRRQPRGMEARVTFSLVPSPSDMAPAAL